MVRRGLELRSTYHPLQWSPTILILWERHNPQKKYPIWRYNIMLIETLSYNFLYFPWHFFKSMSLLHKNFARSLPYSIFFDRQNMPVMQLNAAQDISPLLFSERQSFIYVFCASPYLVPTISVFDIDYSPLIIHKSRSP